MATAVGVGATGNSEVDGLLSGVRWSGSLTYSFPDSSSDYPSGYSQDNEPAQTGFASAPAAMQAAINYAVALIQGYTNIQISYAGTGSADLQIAQSPAANPTSYAYYPGNYSAGGDIWFGTAYNYAGAKLGNYFFATALHELGHALGLKHSQEAGGPAGVAVPYAHDNSEYTIMSYRSYAGAPLTGYTAEQYGFSQTYMANDILALQTMYGANYNTQSGNTVYTWSTTTGQMFINGVGQLAPGGGVGGSANRIFETVWDGNGVDTYDLSNYSTAVSINLNPGASSITSSAQLAYLGNGYYAAGNVYNAYLFNSDPRSYIENAISGSGNDTLIGNAVANNLNGGGGDDTFTGNAGNDTIVGGSGTDTAVYSGSRANYLITYNSASQTFMIVDQRGSSPDGIDTVTGIENFQFLDGIFASSSFMNNANSAPVVTASAAPLPQGTTSVAASSLFTVNDADGDAIQFYRFWDGTTDPNSGHFELNGVPVAQSLSSFQISAAQLANLTYVPGTVADELWVRASDGLGFGSWTVFTKSPPVNHVPVVTASAAPLPRGTTSVAASSLFTVNDADGDAIQFYRFWDGTTDPNSGHFELNGVPVAQSLSSFQISAAQLANLTYVPGTVVDELWVRASDGLGFGSWTVFTKSPPVNHVPVVTASAAPLPRGTTSVAASSLFTVNDADGDPIQFYRFWDGTTDPNSGHFELNGVPVAQSLSSFQISAAQLADLTYVPGTVADELWVRASDGLGFGSWTVFTKNPPVNQGSLASEPPSRHEASCVVTSGDTSNAQVGQFVADFLSSSVHRNIPAGVDGATNALLSAVDFWVKAFADVAWREGLKFDVNPPTNQTSLVSPAIVPPDDVITIYDQTFAASSAFKFSDALASWDSKDAQSDQMVADRLHDLVHKNISEAADAVATAFENVAGGDSWVKTFEENQLTHEFHLLV